jgi:hypothetical protein
MLPPSSHAIIDRLQADITKLDPKIPSADGSRPGGHVCPVLQFFASVLQDTVETAALTILLVLGSPTFTTDRAWWRCCCGYSGLFAITYFKIGLNQQTAFASIIVGNGINFG